MTQTSTLKRGKPEEVGMDPARIELVRERARGWVANGDTPSLVVLVARRGVVVLEEAYGILRPSDNAPLQTNSIFPVMSTSKPITAAAVMCLVEDGLLSLKHPITDYVPEITSPGADQVLIADLLTHTSGYDDMVVYPHAIGSLHERRPIPDPAPGQHPLTNSLIHHAADAPLTKSPGEAMCYCNFGFELLADIVRRVSGRPFWRFVAARIFEPLGMTNSCYVVPANAQPRRVRRLPNYPAMTNPFLPSIDTDAMDSLDSGGAGVKTTAGDLARFGQMLLNRGVYGEVRVMSRASVDVMTIPQLPAGIPSYFTIADAQSGSRIEYPIRGGSYGYGLFIGTQDDRTTYMNGSLMSPRTYSHEGFGSCSFWMDPDAELVGVYLSVIPKLRSNGMYYWRYDHFQDMVHAAIVD